MAQTKAQLVDISTTGISAGSASTPGITFTGDLNTGIYSPGADQVAISTNGSGRLFVNSTGLVGIGTSDVQEQLHVEATNGNGIRLSRNSLADNEASDIDFTYRSGATYYWVGKLRSIKRSGGGGDFQFCTSSDGNTEPTTPAVVIDKQGRVGIGTTSPTDTNVFGRAVDINGPDGAAVYLRNNGSSTNFGLVGYFTDTVYLLNRASGPITFLTNNAERARIDSSGRLLVGTSSSPSAGNVGQYAFVFNAGNTTGANQAGIFVAARAEAATSITSGEDIGFLTFTDNAGNDFAHIRCQADANAGASDYPGRLVFSTCPDGSATPVERMRITNNGITKFTSNNSYTGINTNAHGFYQSNSSEWILQNVNAASSGIVYGVHSLFSAQTPNNTSSWFFLGSDTTNNKFIVYSNGGIANYSGNNVNLSDEREKKNIEALESTWDCLKHWELKKFHYNEDDDTDAKRYGVIAQQVEEHCPEVISEWVKQKAESAKLDDEGNELEPAKEEIVRMGVKEQQMYWMAIKALQEAQVRIEALEAEVAALKAQ